MVLSSRFILRFPLSICIVDLTEIGIRVKSFGND